MKGPCGRMADGEHGPEHRVEKSGSGLLVLAGAARGILGVHGFAVLSPALFSAVAAAFAFHPEFAFGLEPVVHIAAIHSAFALEYLIGAFGDFFAGENLVSAGGAGIAVAAAIAAVEGRIVALHLLDGGALILIGRFVRRRDFGITFS